LAEEWIIIEDVEVPIIREDGVVYYAVTYLGDKLLKRENIINQTNYKKLSKYIRKYKIKFNEHNIQECNCISEEGLLKLIEKMEPSRYNEEQKIAFNKLLEYFKLPTISVNKIIINEMNSEELEKHNEYYRDIIEIHIKKHHPDKFQYCMCCNKYYPLGEKFFHLQSDRKTYEKKCKTCSGVGILYGNRFVDSLYREHGVEGYLNIKNNNSIVLYKYCIDNKVKLPELLRNKEGYLEIIKWLYNNRIINKDNISVEKLEELGLVNINKYCSTVEIYQLIFGEEFYLYPWKYPNWKFMSFKLNHNIANKILDNYIYENKLIIDDKFNYDYEELLKNAKLTKYLNDTLGFIIQYFKCQYAGYKFKTVGMNYYKNIENRKFDLQWMIEKDLKIPVDKIPLYLTKEGIRKQSGTMRNLLNKYYKNNIFEWVNEVYPNKFIELDFSIGKNRDKFDSVEEEIIDGCLRENLENVLYNEKHNNFTITLNRKIPDWFVFTINGVWIIEYFGLYRKNGGKLNEKYNKKCYNKIEIYKQLKGYNVIYLYPEDMQNNMQGVKNKIESIE